MTTATPRRHFWLGIVNGLPFILVVVPFAMLFGAVAAETGLNVAEAMAMSVLVIAGAAQFTALALMEENAPTLVVIATALIVNLRMALYSASMSQHLVGAKLWQKALVAYLLVDQTYASSALHYERQPKATMREKLAFFAGAALIIAPWWYLFTYIGAVAGAAIPPEYALDFALPICFIGMVAPALRSLPHLAAALVSVAAALAFTWVPYSLGLVIAALLAMTTGALVELGLERRRVPG